jgi:TIR domain
MAYVTGYQHDIFVSYAHIDNEPLGTERGWITNFVAYLKNLLDKGLGSRETDVWMDHELTGNEPFSESIESALTNSAILLVVASPSYFASTWCARERNAFLKAVSQRAAAGARVFRVDLDRIDPEQYPAEFRELLGYPFWTLDQNRNPRTLGVPVVDARRDPDYFTMLTKLRIELGEELKGLRSAQSGQVAAPPGPCIFLAEVTDDQDDLHEELEAYAKQAGLTVLPESWYPRDDVAEFRQRMAADLRRAKVFVQLLSDLPGKKPPGWLSRLPVVQFETAKSAGLPIMQWRSRSLDLEKVGAASPQHHALLTGPDVRACGIEEFKRAVVDEATKTPKPAPSPKAGGGDVLVFVNSDSSDRELAKEVCRILGEEGYGYAMPLLEETSKPAEVREDLELNLSTCNGLILVYGNTPVTWVRRQLAQGRKILSQRDHPLDALALVMGPPAEKQEIGYQLPDMRLYDCRSGLSREVVTAFASALRG